MDLMTILQEVIAIDSTSNISNEPLVSYIERLFVDSDVSCHRLQSGTEGKYNLLLTKGDPGVAGLTLCGHLDTVPAMRESWKSDPWTLTEKDGNLYARGSCDMKGFVAIALQAIERADVKNGSLAVLLTCDEELGSFGAEHIARNGLPVQIPKQVIIGEPTSLQVVRLHKGHLSMQVSVEGVPSHTGFPHLGKNAAVAGAQVIEAIAQLATRHESVRTEASQYFPELESFPVLAVATIQAGKAINVVPESCVLGLGLRLLPDQDQAAAINELEEVISKSCPLPWSLEMLGDNPTMHTSESAEINQWLCSHIGQEQSVGVSFGTDGGYLSRAGYECVLYGPGNIAVAHKPDEYVPIVEMEECVQTIDAAVNYFCGVPA